MFSGKNMSTTPAQWKLPGFYTGDFYKVCYRVALPHVMLKLHCKIYSLYDTCCRASLTVDTFIFPIQTSGSSILG